MTDKETIARLRDEVAWLRKLVETLAASPGDGAAEKRRPQRVDGSSLLTDKGRAASRGIRPLDPTARRPTQEEHRAAVARESAERASRTAER